MDSNQQPGQLIVPHGPENSKTPGGGSPEPDRPPEQPAPTPVPTPNPTPEPSSPAATPPIVSQPSPVPTDAEPVAPAQATPLPETPADNWQFHQEEDGTKATPAQPLPDDIMWTASEFIDHEKGANWYGMLALVGIVAIAVIYFLTKDKITTGIILFVLIFFGFIAARKPQTQQYSLSRAGLQIGPRLYELQGFKTFSIAKEGAIASIVIMPLKRFMPPLTVYVAPDMEEQVVNFLAAYLPFEQHKADAVDSLLRRIHF